MHPAVCTPPKRKITLNKPNDLNRDVIHGFAWDYNRQSHRNRFRFRPSPGPREKLPHGPASTVRAFIRWDEKAGLQRDAIRSQ
jgi:hypothetical protein